MVAVATGVFYRVVKNLGKGKLFLFLAISFSHLVVDVGSALNKDLA